MVSVQPVTPQPAAADGLDLEPGLRDYAAALVDHKWIVLVAVAVGLLAGAFRAFTAVPVYRSDALVQVERLGRGMSTLEEISPGMSEPPSETEVEIIRSRSLLGAVVDELDLRTVGTPRWFPVIGGAIARRYQGSGIAAPWLGLSRFAWGGERLELRRLEVPDWLEGVPLVLIALEAGRFQVVAPSGALLASGQVGQAVSAATPSPDGGQGTVELFVASLRARPGTEFRIVKLPRSAAVKQLQAALQIVERGQRTGVLRITLDGTDPRRVASSLDAIATTYLRQNVDRRSAEAQKTLEFLNTQLPLLKRNLETAESALNEYRSHRGQLDLSLESSSTMEQAVDIERRLQELDLQRTELRQRFTDDHPALLILKQKAAKLQGERNAIEAKIKTLPQAELQLARLTRDVEVANHLYLLLLNRSQELKVVKSGTVGNVRILDTALRGESVGTSSSSTTALGGVLGLLVGAALAIARRAMSAGVVDPDVVERVAKVPVYATLAYSVRQAELVRDFRRGRLKTLPSLAATDPQDIVVEGFRSLRTSLQFTLAEAKNHVIAVSGPSPNVGKSFVSLNLASVLAETGMRVLVVDGDMRNGRLHHVFGAERSPGLSEAVAGTTPIDACIRKAPSHGVDLLATGWLPPNPAEVLSSGRFRELLHILAERYEAVVIDTPPILAVTDATIIGRSCGVNLIVLRSGKHPIREIVAALKCLSQGGVSPHGAIMNGVDRNSPSRRYHYQYAYRKSS